MKHLKSYRLFESQEVIDSAIFNSLANYNLKLFKDIINQYDNIIDYKKTLSYIFTQDSILASGKYLPLLEHIPTKYLEIIKDVDCTHLKKDEHKISTLEYFKYLPNLEMIDCDGNLLENLNGIENIPKLVEFYCAVNKLTSLSGIEKVPGITTLHCNRNDLKSLNGLEHLTGLEYLNCDGNEIKTIEPIINLSELKSLDCAVNKLKNLTGIENLTKLSRLYCNDNNLTTLKGVENLTELETIFCKRNPNLPKELTEKDISSDVKIIQDYYKTHD